MASFVDGMRGNDAVIKLIVGQGRLLTFKSEIAAKNRSPLIATGDPVIADFAVLSNRMIRLMAKRPGITDLSVVCADGQVFGFEVQVQYDLDVLAAHLRQAFPNDLLRLSQLRNVVVVEGEARSLTEVGEVLRMVEADLASAAPYAQSNRGGGQAPTSPAPTSSVPPPPEPGMGGSPAGQPGGDSGNLQTDPGMGGSAAGQPMGAGGMRTNSGSSGLRPQIINLIRVPGVHQVMLQVRIAELNRTALRQIGADMLFTSDSGNLIGTSIAGSTLTAAGLLTAGPSTTAFGLFPTSNFNILVTALRKNSLLSIMAEPNLVAMSGMQASFLAGGQFPVPVPQGGTGASNVVTVQWQNFGVQLNFIPYVLADESIRLNVNPIVSTIDPALGTTLVAGGSPVPGLDTRQAQTTVEMRSPYRRALPCGSWQ